MTPRVGVNCKVEIQASLGSAKTISNITQANPGVVTATGHGFSNGDVVVLAVPQGMIELDKQAARVANRTTDTFQLEGIDTTNYSDFVADDDDSPPASSSLCTATKVASFVTWGNTTGFDRPNAEPNKLDVSTLLDTEDQYVFGRKSASGGNVATILQPTDAGQALVDAASDSQTPLVCRLRWATGQSQIFNAYWSGGVGFSQGNNAVATSTAFFTKIKKALDYAA